LADVQIPVGSNFANQMWMNIGSFSTTGVELGLNYDLFRSAKAGAFKWDISYNISVNKIEITDYPPIASNARSGLQGANGYMTEIHQKGYAPFSYFVYQQVYDSNNKPVEGVFADRNGDGKLDENDRYIYHHPNPDATMGLATNMSFKNFDFSMAWRASVGNYIFNNIKAINSYGKMLNPSGSYLKNVVSAKYQEQNDYKVLSDQWVENGSFLKWDNATIGYSISNVLGNGTRLRVYGSVQNILCLTKADVNDPKWRLVAMQQDWCGTCTHDQEHI
jgi:iron complex outermembrane receptor protein